jgi:hypothetical protein
MTEVRIDADRVLAFLPTRARIMATFLKTSPH